MGGKLIVNVKNIKNNILNIKARTNGSLFCAVVKANCYGFGINLCKYLEDVVDYFAVATITEARELASIVNKRILVLTPPSVKELDDKLQEYKNIEFAIDNIDTLKGLVSNKNNYKVHIAVNTGMNRHGVNYEEYLKMLYIIKRSHNVSLIGVFSHFYSNENNVMDNQYNRFKAFVCVAKEYNKNILCHLSNSRGLDYSLDMVRVGIGMYGIQTTDCFRLESNIISIRTIYKGDVVGYNADYVANKKVVVAVVPLGYADGIMRAMGGGNVLINGKICSIIGNICMDCFMVDVSKCNNVKVGDKVVIVGSMNKKNINICQMAAQCDTICYELLSRFGNRICREYRE